MMPAKKPYENYSETNEWRRKLEAFMTLIYFRRYGGALGASTSLIDGMKRKIAGMTAGRLLNVA